MHVKRASLQFYPQTGFISGKMKDIPAKNLAGIR
jgi:hypothetical protein